MTTEQIAAADCIAIHELTDRVEELEDAYQDGEAASPEDAEELTFLRNILEELQGQGGDEKWRGDWYPSELIHDCHFTDYAREMLEDCGTIPRDLPSWVEIDWEATARNVRMDYSAIEVHGCTFWFR